MSTGNIVTIVPVFNRRHTILAALDSIQSQTLRPAQLIVVDDGSTDGGDETVRQWMHHAGGSLNCRLIRQSNSGVAAARNHGLSQADASDFVAFLDSDDRWPADFLERTHAALSSDAGAVAATCDRQISFTDSQRNIRYDCSTLAVDPILCLLRDGGGISSATLFRRSAINRRGGFPPKLTGEDVALFLELCLDGTWLHAPGEPVTYTNGFAQRLGEEENLSRKFNDNFRCWANIVEDFFARGDDRVLLARVRCKQLIARLWYKAGRELCQKSSPQEALACFQKSLEWTPWRVKYNWWTFYTKIKTIRHTTMPADAENHATAVSV